MLSGMTAGEAQKAREAEYERWLDYFLKGEGSKLSAGPLAARIVLADRMISKLYGDPTATVTKPAGQKAFQLSLPLKLEGGTQISAGLILIPLGLLLLGGGSNEQKAEL